MYRIWASVSGNAKTLMGVLELWLDIPDNRWTSILDTQKNVMDVFDCWLYVPGICANVLETHKL